MLQRRDISSLEISFFICFHRSRVGRAGATGGDRSCAKAGHRGVSAPRPSSRTTESERRHDQNIGIRVGRGGLLARTIDGLGAADHPRRLDHPGRGIEILDDAPSGAVPRSRQGLQGGMGAVPGHRTDGAGDGGGRARLLDPGRAVDGAGSDSGQSRDLHRRPACGREAGQLLGLLGGEGELADQDHRRHEGQERGHQCVRLRHLWPDGAAAQAQRRRRREGHQAGRDRIPRLRGCDPLRACRRGRAQPAVRRARGGQGRPAQAVRARGPAEEHRAHHGGVPEGLRRQESRSGSRLRARSHRRHGQGDGGSRSRRSRSSPR